MQNAPYFSPLPRGVRTQNLLLPLDFIVRTTQGIVVPQKRWTPNDEIDARRYVAGAMLQLPIYFVNRNGTIGFWLLDILQGRDSDLYNRSREAPLGGKGTTHLRINVSSHTFLLIHISRRRCPHSGLAVDFGSDRYPLETRLVHGTRSHFLDS